LFCVASGEISELWLLSSGIWGLMMTLDIRKAMRVKTLRITEEKNVRGSKIGMDIVALGIPSAICIFFLFFDVIGQGVTENKAVRVIAFIFSDTFHNLAYILIEALTIAVGVVTLFESCCSNNLSAARSKLYSVVLWKNGLSVANFVSAYSHIFIIRVIADSLFVYRILTNPNKANPFDIDMRYPPYLAPVGSIFRLLLALKGTADSIVWSPVSIAGILKRCFKRNVGKRTESEERAPLLLDDVINMEDTLINS